MKKTAALALALLASTSLQALAAATPEEADRIAKSLQAYLGAVPGVVTVAPAGESYDTTIDLAPLFAKIKEPGLTVSISPIVMKLTAKSPGQWQVDQDQALSFQFKVDGKADVSGSIGQWRGTGTFDESLGTFASSSSDMSQIAFQQLVTEAGQTTNVKYSIASLHVDSAATAATDGVDATSKYTYKDLSETISTPAAPDGSMPPMEITVTTPGGGQDATMKGLKSKAIMDLVAWGVAHPSQDLIKASQAELKDKLRAALPLWQTVSGTATMDQLAVNTMIGVFGIEQVQVLVDMNGVVADGKLRESFTFSGLKPPEGIVPPFATGLVPKNITIDFNVADFDLAAPAKLIIDNFDLMQEPPLKPEMEEQLLKALLPKGAVTINLGPSELLAAIYNLTFDGSMTTGPVAMPAGQANVRLKGLDEIMAALQSSPPEMGLQGMAPMGMMAKGMAKAEADGTLYWKIESTPEGGVLINGVDVTKMGGGQ